MLLFVFVFVVTPADVPNTPDVSVLSPVIAVVLVPSVPVLVVDCVLRVLLQANISAAIGKTIIIFFIFLLFSNYFTTTMPAKQLKRLENHEDIHSNKLK